MASELGLGIATPEFAKAFAIVAIPIVIGLLVMVWFAMKPR
jgi:hypothetical protein